MLEPQVQAVAPPQDVQRAQGFRHDFPADPVPGNHGDVECVHDVV